MLALKLCIIFLACHWAGRFPVWHLLFLWRWASFSPLHCPWNGQRYSCQFSLQTSQYWLRSLNKGGKICTSKCVFSHLDSWFLKKEQKQQQKTPKQPNQPNINQPANQPNPPKAPQTPQLKNKTKTTKNQNHWTFSSPTGFMRVIFPTVRPSLSIFFKSSPCWPVSVPTKTNVCLTVIFSERRINTQLVLLLFFCSPIFFRLHLENTAGVPDGGTMYLSRFQQVM